VFRLPLSQVQKKRQRERDAYDETRKYGRPQVLHPESPTFNANEDPQDDRRYDDVEAEETADWSREQLIEEHTQIQAVFS
jgi:hypothetical protein